MNRKKEVEKIKKYILIHLDEKLNLKSLADHVNMSPSYFHKVFTHEEGETPLDYIRRNRVKKAMALMSSEKPIFLYEIAEICGFTTQSMMVNAFRKYYGDAPHKFKK